MTTFSELPPLRKTLLWLGALLVLAQLFPTALRLLFASNDELSFDTRVLSSTCAGLLADERRPPENCVVIYGIELGNTGTNPQPLIEVRLGGAPEIWRLDEQVVDIVASARRRGSPEVRIDSLPDAALIRVENLEPNRLLSLRLAFLGLQASRQLETMTVEVSASGSLINTSPHLTVLSRFLRNLFGVF
ncbi:MAG: hypothetical protein RLZZ385_839 [Pseudomonadota bacterium]